MEGRGLCWSGFGVRVDICVVGRLPRAELPAGRRLREGGLSNQQMSKLSKERKRMNWVS